MEEVKKPPYRVPSMKEIEKIRGTNGYSMVSTFSGCGGSCLGFEMAGFKVLWASEFIPEARDTYKRNHPGVYLDPRDIRRVKAEQILEAIGKKRGELDVFEGSPPCASFSTAGSRDKGWGKVKWYSSTKQRTDDLFFEYARLLKELQPKVFVAENVSGLIKGSAIGYFKMIMRELKSCGYNVRSALLNAQWLGVPQMRERLIFIGVRDDLEVEPRFPSPLKYTYTFKDAIGDELKLGPIEPETNISGYSIGELWHEVEVGGHHHKRFSLGKPHPDRPCFTVTQAMAAPNGNMSHCASLVHPYEKRYLSIAEVKRLCAFPDDFILTGTFGQKWERVGRAVPPVMMSHIANTVKEILNEVSENE